MVGCGVVSNLARGLADWFRGSCWNNSPSETSTASRPSRTCTSNVVINRLAATPKYQISLPRLSEEGSITDSLPLSPRPSPRPPVIADVASVSHESTLQPRKPVHATSCSMDAASGLAPLIFNISSQQPLTIAFTNTDTTSRVFPPLYPAAPAASVPSTVSAYRSVSSVSSCIPQMQSEGGDDDFNEFEQECLLIHNDYREKHGVPPLRLSKQMCETARRVATDLCDNIQLPVLTSRDIDNKKKMCEFAEGMASALCGNTQLPPVSDRKYGEIVLVTRSTDPISAYEACHKWYGQSHGFQFGVEPKASKSRKHKCNFTQMIWKGTRELGIGTAFEDGTSAVIGLYYPAGNVSGQYAQNVPRPRDLGPL